MNLDVIVGVGGTVAAVAVSQWPRIAALLRRMPKQPDQDNGTPSVSATTTYQQALIALSIVRSRLLATGGIGDASQKAIETLTLSLVAGSDK